MHFSDGLHIYLALFSEDLLGVGCWGGFSSHHYTPAFWRSWHMPIIDIFCSARCIVKHPSLSEKYWGLRSVLEVPLQFFVSEVFLRKLWKWWRTCWLFPRDLDWLFRHISSQWSPIFLPGCWSSNRSCIGVVLWASPPLVVPCVKGAQKFSEGLFRKLRGMSGGVFSLPSILVVPWRKRTQQDVFPSTWWDFLCLRWSSLTQK